MIILLQDMNYVTIGITLNTYETMRDKFIVSIEIQSLICWMQLNAAEALREANSDGWLSDHTGYMRELQKELDALKEEYIKLN